MPNMLISIENGCPQWGIPEESPNDVITHAQVHPWVGGWDGGWVGGAKSLKIE